MTDWDGLERRSALILAEELKPKRETVEAPVVIVLVGFAAALLMQAAAIWSHGVIIQNQHRNEEYNQKFACYVVHTAQGESGTGVLTACGFLNLGVPK